LKPACRKKKACISLIYTGFKGGGDRIRTGVQTYSPKAFYMLITALIVGKKQEQHEPTLSLAEWS
jgi:hypothetical protein